MSKTVQIWTVQLAQWRKVRELGIKLLDTTAASGESAFAPHMGDVQLYKAGNMSEEEYTEIYYQKMRDSYLTNSERWELLSSPSVCGHYDEVFDCERYYSSTDG